MRIPLLALTLSLAVGGSVAQATPLTFSPTPTGLTFTIENKGTVGGDTYAIELTLTTDAALYTDSGDADYLAAFSVDFSGGSLNGLTLADQPAGYSWSLKPADEVAGNSASCGGSQPGAACVEEASSGTNLALDAVASYSWLFHVDIGSSGFADITTLNVGIATLKSNGGWQPGSNFTAFAGSLAPDEIDEVVDQNDLRPVGDAPVPEPTSLVLLGSGLLFAASRARRRK